MPARQARSGVSLGAATTAVNGTSGAGARTKSAPRLPGLANMGAAGYLWLLVIVEVATIGLMRHIFRDHHGG